MWSIYRLKSHTHSSTLLVGFGTDIEVQTDVSTPIQGSSSVNEDYDTRQGNIYVQTGGKGG